MLSVFHVFFFNDTATTEIYTLSLHDALPISGVTAALRSFSTVLWMVCEKGASSCDISSDWKDLFTGDRKSTRLNSSHSQISYAVFCLKKKKKKQLKYNITSGEHDISRATTAT